MTSEETEGGLFTPRSIPPPLKPGGSKVSPASDDELRPEKQI